MKELILLFWLILAFLLVPALEITLFIWVGGMIGPWWVFAIIILTGIIGVAIARQQGLTTWNRLQYSIKERHPPGDHIIDGLCIIIGGIMLFTPGFVTDFIGFLLVLPLTRRPFRILIKTYILTRMTRGKITFRRF